MANVYAVKSGNWSDPTVWNTGALPTTADDVFSNNFSVTVDGTFTVLSIRNSASTPIVAGGLFSAAAGSDLTCTSGPITSTPNNSALYYFALAAPATATLRANLAVTVNNTQTVVVSNSGTLNIVGSLTGGSGTNGFCVYCGTTGGWTLNVTGNVNQGAGSGGFGINVATSGTINVTGNVGVLGGGGCAAINVPVVTTLNVTGAVRGGAASAPGISANTASTVTITGDVTASTSSAISLTAASTLNVVGTLTASAATPAVQSTGAAATNILSGPFISNNGMMAFYGPRLLLRNTPSTYWSFTTQNLLTNRTVYTSDYPGDPPAVGNVRSGTTFGAGLALTGTMIVPPAASVGFGVPVDATTGTAASSPADIWNYATSAATTAGSMGERLKNCSTVATTGDQWAAG